MNQKEKQLLLKDLCARLPYGVIQVFEDNEYPPCVIIGYDGEDFIDEEGWSHRIGEFKPYLRPMSSMTEEEKEEYCEECSKVLLMLYEAEGHYPVIDYLLSHHFDFRGLIPMGLALEAPKDMYKEK